jgi:uncharacterized protein (DUF924 family)
MRIGNLVAPSFELYVSYIFCIFETSVPPYSRMLFRNTADAFAHDSLALTATLAALEAAHDTKLEATQAAFLYMPLMHSESAEMHAKAVELFGRPGMEDFLSAEMKHKAIVDRFGRYPHRNKILGRDSTPEEEEFLKEPGSSF